MKASELIEVLKKDMDSLMSQGAERPYLVRHSQGDHWDLLVIYPLGQKKLLSISPERARLENETQVKIRPLLAWHEDLYVTGPSPDILAQFLGGQGLVHFEMMQALPGMGVRMVLSGHIHVSHIAPFRDDPGILFVQNGTSLSTRRRGEANVFLTLDLEGQNLRVTRHYATPRGFVATPDPTRGPPPDRPEGP